LNEYLALLVTLLIRRIRHLTQILLICSCACEVGFPSTFEWENAYAIHCFNWNFGKISHFGQYT